MRLAEARYENAVTGCCAPLDVARWDEQRFTWDHKPFVRGHIRAVMHMPLNFGSVMRRLHAEVEAAGAYPEEPLWLTDELSPWGSDVYLAVEKNVRGAQMAELSGTFLTKVFEGPFKDAGKWAEEMKMYVAGQGERLEKIYFFYPTCPDCSKKLGKNEVVLFACCSCEGTNGHTRGQVVPTRHDEGEAKRHSMWARGMRDLSGEPDERAQGGRCT